MREMRHRARGFRITKCYLAVVRSVSRHQAACVFHLCSAPMATNVDEVTTP